MGTHIIKLPDVGEGVAEAELVEWNVKVGDVVAEDEVIGAVMTDKATVEIPSPVQGEITWLGAEVGDIVSVGSEIVKLATVGDEEEAEETAPAPVAQPEEAPADDAPKSTAKGSYVIKLPDVGEGVAEAELVEWNVKVGDMVAEDEVLGAVMTDKATVEIPSPVQGEITWLGAEVGDVVSVGSEIVKLATLDGESGSHEADIHVIENDTTPEPSAVPAATPEADSKAEVLPPRTSGEKVLAAPAVRSRAKFLNLDLSQFTGTGPEGSISHEDLDRYLLSQQAKGGSAAASKPAAPYAGTGDEPTKDVKVVGLRRMIAEKMSVANARIPHITYVEEIDVTELEGLRQSLNAQKDETQTKLSLLPFLMKSMVTALSEQPGINAHFDDDNGIVHQFEHVHVGIAAQTNNGLMVPVVKNAQNHGLWSSAKEIARLAQAAKDGSAKREELTGSTITITSLGALGGVVNTPVINHPEVAIVGVNKMMTMPKWDGEKFVPRKIMNLSSSFDHRVVDGYDAAVFIQRVKSLLEKPLMIFS
ncbi:2-oxoisovalerate dehydrogenase E2 component (dihydrolipoyl transacylase) [Maritalea mobilis]|uniref:Dihydrolipoamide acetyltransferase component of pyruvate dehydrogenase complex n=1 Tax=Maritalea mobilis TaxID=483324 RepID=A0A4R6VQQ8_9HYPH|nr:2-oxoisovalerate dehydrogenase E2 component (dihydrolipoyl transacylase) [Maritalea mobilis]